MENGGSAFFFSKGVKVRYDPGGGIQVYESLIDSNTDLPTVTASWKTLAYAANTIMANATGSTGTFTGIAIAASELVGRGASGNIGPITLGAGLSLSGSVLNNTCGLGTVTSVAVAMPAEFSVSGSAFQPDTSR